MTRPLRGTMMAPRAGKRGYADVTTASAASKAILFGEHAVVYGRPALAVPVSDVRALVEVTTALPNAGITIHSHDLGRTFRLQDPSDEIALPLQATVRNTLKRRAPKFCATSKWIFGISSTPATVLSGSSGSHQ